MTAYRYYTTSELPVIPVHWKKSDGTYWDFSSGWTFVALFTDETGDLAYTKSSGITGAAGTVTVPNVVIAPIVGELATIGAGMYDVRLNATRASDSYNLPSPTPIRVHIEDVPV